MAQLNPTTAQRFSDLTVTLELDLNQHHFQKSYQLNKIIVFNEAQYFQAFLEGWARDDCREMTIRLPGLYGHYFQAAQDQDRSQSQIAAKTDLETANASPDFNNNLLTSPPPLTAAVDQLTAKNLDQRKIEDLLDNVIQFLCINGKTRAREELSAMDMNWVRGLIELGRAQMCHRKIFFNTSTIT